MMTKLRKILLIPALIIVCISGFFSCGVDRWPEYAHQTALDTWMYDIMQQNYLWYQDLPSYDDINLFLEPSSFLSKVKSSKDSYSFADSVMATPLPTYGFDYSLVRNPDNDTAYNALITYVIPGSPAASAGLERGDWIVKVDTSYISKKYESQLLQGTEPIEVTLGKYQKVTPEETPGEDGKEETEDGKEETEDDEEEEDIYRVVITGEPVEIGAATPLTDNPVHCKKILPLTDGSKVGYLMYNSFTAGTKEDAEKYNDELREWSNELAQENIRKVILDLRYNEGGSIDCVQLLSTIFVPSYYHNQTMAYLEYNDKNTDKNTTLTFNTELLKSGSSLELTTLIVLISGETAGAPEMLMHCLNGKIQQLVAIGSSTKGQNVGTEQFVNEEFLWSVNPVVCTIYNSEHDTYSGFKATYSVNASTDYLNFLPFGNPEETLLSVALGFLNGTYPPKEEDKDKTARSLKIEKSVNSSASRIFIGGNGLRIK
ncbi:S41 family peptidase [uncultured Bacteroides sp.]|uniref:S41 family peptidase n=1 Tax=uncultured Bacteroides sp. TaxID=162156 RepID=UPI0026744381|nr:S41 family peptidase [uncultured Bacteroides sp.]